MFGRRFANSEAEKARPGAGPTHIWKGYNRRTSLCDPVPLFRHRRPPLPLLPEFGTERE